MAFWTRNPTFNSLGSGLAKKPTGSMDAAVIAGLGATLYGMWDYDVVRTTEATNKSFANRVAGGGAIVENASFSNLTLGTDKLPYGGAIRRAGVFDGNTIVNGGTFPVNAAARWSKIMTFYADASNGLDGTLRAMWNGPVGGVSNHQMIYANSLITAVVGTTGDTKTLQVRYPLAYWTMVICTWNESTKVLKLGINDEAPQVSASGGTMTQAQNSHYFGGNSTTPSGVFRQGPTMLLYGTTDLGDIYSVGQAANLALVQEWGRRICGRG
jgi:hypothetical protein